MTSRCGWIGIVGRPNVGKSTLLNRVLGQKISITSRKAQTTRHRILGIKTEHDVQTIYVDTPGLHENERRALNRNMNRTVHAAMRQVDLVLFLVDSDQWTSEDDLVLEKLKNLDVPVILVVNKVDKIRDKQDLLPCLAGLAEKRSFATIVPISAKSGRGVDVLEKEIDDYLKEGPHVFPEDYITDRSEQFLSAEMIREKLVRLLGQELPYSTSVEIELFQEDENLVKIHGLIWVERTSQKGIVIGSKGDMLKKIGYTTRQDMERFFQKKVYLGLWVKVKENWSDNVSALKNLGYDKV